MEIPKKVSFFSRTTVLNRILTIDNLTYVLLVIRSTANQGIIFCFNLLKIFGPLIFQFRDAVGDFSKSDWCILLLEERVVWDKHEWYNMDCEPWVLCGWFGGSEIDEHLRLGWNLFVDLKCSFCMSYLSGILCWGGFF